MILSKGKQIPGYEPSLLSSPLGESPLRPQSRNSQRERQMALSSNRKVGKGTGTQALGILLGKNYINKPICQALSVS